MSFFPISFRSCCLAVLASFLVYALLDHGRSLPVHVDGAVEPRFESVMDAFRQNFVDGWERAGASLAVYDHGQKVVDVWGGYADRDALRPWKEDTIQIIFSGTKAVAAVCIAMLVDRGHLSYEDLVTKHWPEFGQNGKENITVEMIMSHTAGLVYLDEDLTVDDLSDHRLLSKRFEMQRPQWPPGTKSGYHIYTLGFLADQLIRRADPKHRSIGNFLREELYESYGVDFHIGLRDEHAIRVARLTKTSIIDSINEALTSPGMLKNWVPFFQVIDRDSLLMRAIRNMAFLESALQMTVNNPEYWKLEQASSLGIGNARSLAKMFSLMGEKRILSQRTLDLLSTFVHNETDPLVGEQHAKGHGFMYERQGEDLVFGHSGMGGQEIYLNVKKGISIAYTTNAMKTTPSPGLCRTWRRLNDAIYDVVDKSYAWE